MNYAEFIESCLTYGWLPKEIAITLEDKFGLEPGCGSDLVSQYCNMED